MSQPTKEVKAVSKKSLVVIVDTGANEKRLEEQGFPRDFQRETCERILTLDIHKNRPSDKETAGYGNWHEVRIKGAITAFGVIASVDGEFRLMFTACQQFIFFTAIVGKKVWSFLIEGTAQDVKGAIRTMYNDSLLRGPRAYDNNNTMIANFWQEALSLVYPEPTIIEVGLRNKEQQYVPSRVYFYPEQPQLNTLAAGGYCYNLDLDVFPREAINKGMGLWTADERKRNDRSGVVNIGSLLVKPGNKQKKQQRPQKRPDTSNLNLKPLSEHLKVHERTEAEKAGDARREAERAAKVPVKAAAPAAKGKTKAKATA
jgi:hypothetical protein